MKQTTILIFCLFVFTLQGTKAQDTSKKEEKVDRFVFKGYPIPFLVSQMPHYFSQIQFAFECSVAPRHTLQFGVAADIPGPISSIIQTLNSMSEHSNDPYRFYGGRGIIGYRYYFSREQTNFLGGYVGAEISVNGIVSEKRLEQNYQGYSSYSGYSSSFKGRSHGIMTNYNVTVGCQFIKVREKRNGGERKVSIDIGVSIGYRYHYFWRHYDGGNIEYDSSLKQGQSLVNNLYAYYKKVPVGGSFNLSFGGVF